MSLNQLELALKIATSKSRTPVSMYQFDPIWSNISKTSASVSSGESPSIQQKYSHTKLTQRSSALYFAEFRLGERA